MGMRILSYDRYEMGIQLASAEISWFLKNGASKTGFITSGITRNIAHPRCHDHGSPKSYHLRCEAKEAPRDDGILLAGDPVDLPAEVGVNVVRKSRVFDREEILSPVGRASWKIDLPGGTISSTLSTRIRDAES